MKIVMLLQYKIMALQNYYVTQKIIIFISSSDLIIITCCKILIIIIIFNWKIKMFVIFI